VREVPREVFVTVRMVLSDGVSELYETNAVADRIREIDGVHYAKVVKFVRGDKLNKQANDDYDD